MVHTVYDVNSTGYFFGQTATVPQVGGGFFEGTPYLRGYGFFEGQRYLRGFGGYQQGRGVGSMLMRAWRYLLPRAKEYLGPLAKEATKALTEEGLSAGSRILEDIGKGQSLGEAVQTQGTAAAKRLAKRAGKRLEQAGSGRKRRASNRSVKNLHVVGRSVLQQAAIKKRRQNTLGTY